MSAVLLPQGKQQYFTNTGIPLVGGKVFTYDTGTTTPRTTWADGAQSSPNTNPIILDARGEATVFWSGAYRVVVQDSLGNAIWTVDGVSDQNYADQQLRSDLANASSSILGADLVGFAPTVAYTGATVGGFLHSVYGRSAIEIATAKTPVNYLIPPPEVCGVLYVDRYATNTTPGTTNMSAGLQACIDIALAVSGSGRQGYPIRFFAGAYLLGTAPTWPGAQVNILPLDIGGAGWASTQLICGLAANSSAMWPMAGLDGWYLHDFLMCNDSAHKNIGIEVAIGAGGSIEWKISRVISMMHGPAGIKISDTNTGQIDDFAHWPGNNPDLIVPKALTASEIGHGIWMTGTFCHNVHIRDPNVSISSGYGTPVNGARGIKMDCTFSFGVTIDGSPLAQTLSGLNNEISIEIVPTNACAGLVLSNLYCEGATVILKNVQQSRIGPFTNGEVGGALRCDQTVRWNTFDGIRVGNVDLTDASGFAEGNTFINCLTTGAVAWVNTTAYIVGNYVTQGGVTYRCILAHTNQVPPNAVYWTAISTFFDGNEAINLSSQPNKLIGSFGASLVGKVWRKLMAYATPNLAAIDCLGPDHHVLRVTGGGAMTFPNPLHPRNGVQLTITVRNEFGAMGVITWFVGASGWVNPAVGFNRTICFFYDSDFGGWRQLWVTTLDAAN